MPSLDSPSIFHKAAADYGAMDCVAANVAVLISLHGGEARQALGSQWYFAFDADTEGGNPRLRLDRMTLADQLRGLGGMCLREHRLRTASADEVKTLVGLHGPVVVHGDAYDLPWTPLYGREHIEHTFLITEVAYDGMFTVYDAYTNKTEHGDATPTVTTLDSATATIAINSLDTPSRHVAFSLAPPEDGTALLDEVIAENCRAVLAQTDAMRRFVAYYEDAQRRPGAARGFALACWLTARKRTLHERWLGDVARGCELLPISLVASFRERVAIPWQRASEFAYLAERRVRSGRQAPSAAFRMVDDLGVAEREVAGAMLTAIEAAR